MQQWYFLSERGLERESSHISYAVNYELEDVLMRMTGGTLIAPSNSELFMLSRNVPRVGRGLGWMVGRTVGRYERADVSTAGDADCQKILFVTGMGSKSLRILNAIPDWRRRFDRVVGLVLDAFEPYPMGLATKMDHLFVIIPEMVDELRRSLGINVSFIPLACDVLDKGSMQPHRSVDVLAYGRMFEEYVRYLDEHFLRPDCHQLYLTTFSHPRAPDWHHQRKQFWSVLSRTQLSVAFAPVASQTRFRGLPVISARWYEGMAAGSIMVGKRPMTPAFEEVFPWTDAAIDLPDAGAAPGFMEDLLSQHDRLSRARVRNHMMMLARLDARVLFTRMCSAIGLEVPQAARTELLRHEKRLREVAQIAREQGIHDDGEFAAPAGQAALHRAGSGGPLA